MKAVFIRQGFTLVPTDDVGREALAKLKIGQKAMVEVRSARNPEHHRMLFAVLRVVVDNSDTYPSEEALLDTLKIAAGHTETRMTLDGRAFIVPKSIAFESMSQEDFRGFFDKSIAIITTRIIPGLGKKELLDHVEEILRGRFAA